MKKKRPDAQTEALLKRLAERGAPPITELTPEEARTARNPLFVELGGPGEDVADARDRRIPGPKGEIPIRIYTPEGAGEFPILVYFHGGGWVIGNLDTHDSLCRALANAVSCIVVAVDYGLSPENKFPAPLEDCYAATRWVAGHAGEFCGDGTRIAVGGDSAGGNMATAVCLMAREKGGASLLHQLLIYPVVDLYTMNTASYCDHGEGYLLTAAGMFYYRDHYLPNEEARRNSYASPLFEKDLSRLPSATVVIPRLDVLADEGTAYAERLKEAGVPVTCLFYDQMIHAFLNFLADVPMAKKAISDVGSHLKKAFERT
jgi:acetyl esterase